ncbi:MAG: porin family protein [Pseudomonadota bacterium]
MKSFRYIQLPFAAALLCCAGAHAQDDTSFYATGVVGIGFLGSEDLAYRDGVISSTAEADFDPSFTGGGTVGYRLNDAWRIEGELLYRRNEMDEITLDGVGSATEGDFASLSVGLSALYDFRPFDNDRLSAYVGAGVVFVQEIDIDFEVGGMETSFETDDIGFQVQFGGRYDLNDKLFVDVGVRYLTLSGVEMEFPADTSRIVEADYSPFSVTAGLGWRF